MSAREMGEDKQNDKKLNDRKKVEVWLNIKKLQDTLLIYENNNSYHKCINALSFSVSTTTLVVLMTGWRNPPNKFFATR